MGEAAGIMTAVGLAAWPAYLALLGLKAALALRSARKQEPGSVAPSDVTLLQPILSGDPQLEATLASNLDALPASVRFVWLVDEDDPTAQEIGERLIGRAAGRATLVHCPPVGAGLNPKTVKLDRGLAHVTTEFVAVLDDDTTLPAATLGRALHGLKDADLYTGLPCYAPGVNVWSALVTNFVNNNSILTYLPILAFTPPLTINGMFYAMRTHTLRGYGGFATVAVKLCDDYAVARLVRSHGGRLRQGTASVVVATTVPSLPAYLRLMHRWFAFANVLVFDQPLHLRALLFVLLGLPPLLLWLGLVGLAGSPWGLAVSAGGLIARYALLRVTQRRIFGFWPASSWLLSPLSELLQPLHLAHALAQRTLRWRTRLVRLGRDGAISYVTRGKDG